MKAKQFSWEELNAYVDGEADVRVAAEIAHVAAGDRAVADAIATIAGLKAAAADALAAEPPATVRPQRSYFSARSMLAMAAALVAGVAIAATLFLMTPTAVDRPDPRDEALAVHETWLAAETSQIDRSDWPGDGLAAILIGGRKAVVPDLAFARLRIGHLAVEPAGEGFGLFAGYVGRNGCRLGLWIAPAEETPASGAAATAGSRRIATWQASGLFYAAVAQDMDPARFLAITKHLQEATRPAAGSADGQLMASRRPIANEPCIG